MRITWIFLFNAIQRKKKVENEWKNEGIALLTFMAFYKNNSNWSFIALNAHIHPFLSVSVFFCLCLTTIVFIYDCLLYMHDTFMAVYPIANSTSIHYDFFFCNCSHNFVNRTAK